MPVLLVHTSTAFIRSVRSDVETDRDDPNSHAEATVNAVNRPIINYANQNDLKDLNDTGNNGNNGQIELFINSFKIQN